MAVPFRITLTNPTNKVMYLYATLNSAPSFMFAGHRNVRRFLNENRHFFNKLSPNLAECYSFLTQILRFDIQFVRVESRMATTARVSIALRSKPK